MPTIHGKSPRAIKYFREEAAALAIYWVYCARVNYENVAWGSLRGLAHDTGWASPATCKKARDWLIKHKALEEVKGYVRPAWRKLPEAERKKKVGLDRNQYFRPTGVLEINGDVLPLLYHPDQEKRRKRKPDVPPDSTSKPVPDVSPDDTSNTPVDVPRGVTSHAVEHLQDGTELDSLKTQLDSSRSSELDGAAAAATAEPERPNIFTYYEQAFGFLITPMVADELKLVAQEFPDGWVADAFKEAALSNGRNLKYVKAILLRWQREGKSNGAPKPHVLERSNANGAPPQLPVVEELTEAQLAERRAASDALRRQMQQED